MRYVSVDFYVKRFHVSHRGLDIVIVIGMLYPQHFMLVGTCAVTPLAEIVISAHKAHPSDAGDVLSALFFQIH